jgi:hypothetical protein
MYVSDISQERKRPLISGCCKRLTRRSPRDLEEDVPLNI